MKTGTLLYYQFDKNRPLFSLLRQIDNLAPQYHYHRQPNWVECKISNNTIKFKSIDDFESHIKSGDEKLQGVWLFYTASNALLTHTFHFNQGALKNLEAVRFMIILKNTDFWPGTGSFGSSTDQTISINEIISEYIYFKNLFVKLKADECAASDLNNFYNFGDYGYDEIFKFTKNGPQKLVRPLEEKRRPYSIPGSQYELSTDPKTGLHGWQFIVNKPFIDAVSLE